jgi:hypothetical protein
VFLEAIKPIVKIAPDAAPAALAARDTVRQTVCVVVIGD